MNSLLRVSHLLFYYHGYAPSGSNVLQIFAEMITEKKLLHRECIFDLKGLSHKMDLAFDDMYDKF
jgi:hypothetical protein